MFSLQPPRHIPTLPTHLQLDSGPPSGMLEDVAQLFHLRGAMAQMYRFNPG